MQTTRSFATSVLACALLSVPPRVLADYTVKVDAATTIQSSWDGWGTSLCWWANHYGERVDIADALFTLNKSVTIQGSSSGLPGLGFNIARYNIGGSSKNVVDDDGKEVAMKQSKNMQPYRFMESFWIDWMSADTASASWNWDADPRQRAMLMLAIERGADQLEAFSNSPPWWMNHNHATAGGDNGKKDNLTPHNYEEFALYLATVVNMFKTRWGVNFDYVEPFNEPSESWWEFPSKQEGCHFSWATQKKILILLRKQLDALNLQDVAIATPDENSPDATLHTLEDMEKTAGIVETFTKINTHGYLGLDAYRGDKRKPLRDLTNKFKKTLWDSELAENDGSGLTMAESIALDINEMGAKGIVYWQALDSGGWGLIASNPGDDWMGEANPKYYVMAQYTRHIRPGMQILASDDVKTVVAFDADKKCLVLVTVNVGDAQSITFDLASFGAVTGPVMEWTTETSGTGALYVESTCPIVGKSFTANLPAKSVRTFEVSISTLVS
ncbi:RxLR-like protein [Plasmopara halstedii]|uniref:RxLR-like protein n=1 Tax=Plasmopara halstedii TaxID=4781 RepID=A0A0P1ACI3_PLAHL|nr:RxLR-like protein [Plasmopara halstedii]CEG38064.1 RxLR-like protein [Plasmopara halstedii]|eukprot:XP_024574433.1 RxLR-like protein [Plasmopara halstedii]